MGDVMKSLIISVVAALLVWSVQNYFKDIPAATYWVTNPIEIPGTHGEKEYAQEVVIENSGAGILKDVSVRVPYSISSYTLEKPPGLVVERLGENIKNFELVYPDLPVGQKLNLQLRYSGKPIERKWFTVIHSAGAAKSQDGQQNTVGWTWIWVGFSSAMILSSLMDFRRSRRDMFLKYADATNSFRNEKPWYLSGSEWPEVQAEAITRLMERYRYGRIQESEAYRLLSREKPKLLDEKRWTDLQVVASSKVLESFTRQINCRSSSASIADAFKIKKPENMSAEDWGAVSNHLSDCLSEKLVYGFSGGGRLVNALVSDVEKIKGIPDELHNEIVKTIRERYAHSILMGLVKPFARVDAILDGARLDLLTPEQSREIKEVSMLVKRMSGLPQRWDLYHLSDFVGKGCPEWFDKEDFKYLEGFVSDSRKLANGLAEVEKIKAELQLKDVTSTALINKVTSQLFLIDRVLSDPREVNKIEDYDITFAPGNRRNLEKIAEILMNSGR